jgi:hypothetical protein
MDALLNRDEEAWDTTLYQGCDGCEYADSCELKEKKDAVMRGENPFAQGVPEVFLNAFSEEKGEVSTE